MDFLERYLAIYDEAISTHCEKPVGFISEPVNTVSNIAFFVSAFFIHKILRKNKISNPHIQRLLWLTILVGLGSTAYHGFNNPYTLILDQIPIYAFILYSIYIITIYASKNRVIRFVIPLLLILIQILVLKYVKVFFLDIPVMHIINLLFISFLIAWFYKKLGKMALKLIPVVLVYGLAIAVRGFDIPVCPINKFGTHFLWHILTAIAVYLTVKSLVEIDNFPKG